MSLHILVTQFLRKTTNLVVHQSWYLYTLDHWEGFWKVIHWNAACWYKQQTLAQIVLQATLHTFFEICHPILLFGTILLLNWCYLPPYTLIWHYTFIRHTRVPPSPPSLPPSLPPPFLLKKPAKNNTYRSKIKIPTFYCWCKVDSCLHCKFRNGAWRTRAAFQDSVLTFEDWIIYKD